MPALPLRMRSPRILPRPEICLVFEPRTSRNLGEIGLNLKEVSGSKTLKSEHWQGFPAGLVVGLLIRRSLVRAQVGEPKIVVNQGLAELQGLFRVRSIGGVPTARDGWNNEGIASSPQCTQPWIA